MYTPRLIFTYELEKYRQHLLSLDNESRVLRFGYPISNENINAFCDTIEKNPKEHTIFAIENAALEFVGIGHIVVVDEKMELAFSVLPEYQGQGIGNTLIRRCIQWCRTNNILQGCMVCLSKNYAMRHLCLKNGIHIHNEYGDLMGDIVLDSPTLSTYVSEGVDLNIAALDYMSKRFYFSWPFRPQNA